MMKKMLLPLLTLFLFCSCGLNKAKATEETVKSEKSVEQKVPLVVPVFDADSAYLFVAQQVAFGPRVPESKAHARCTDYFVSAFSRFGVKTQVQQGVVERFDGKIIKAKNIIASFNEAEKRRILLCAHWDSRPYSDNDSDEANWYKPILGANDGASGCGVLMELARQISFAKPNIGVDIVLFDMEDSGTPQFFQGQTKQHTWCLGSQYWAQTPHVKNYRAEYGILLDMVGAKDAMFYKERYSVHYAALVVDKIWQCAERLGYGNYFINELGGYIIDDHYYINELAGIPMVDIIQYCPSESGFGDYWHTQNDDMDIIDKNTLKVIGQTLLELIYQN
ncbi:MAG: M28 family peptidase [Paludibacteraceae bacterium]|nr:M28 family peptidase [Paludibacteraceae bacterium]